jgi:hypothetical protein
MINQDDLEMDIGLSHKQIFNSDCTKFLGLIIVNKLSWKDHIDYLTTKLSTTCFIMRVIKPLLSLNTLKMIYFSYIHSVMTYGIIFWGNSPHIITPFRIQKKVVRIIMGLKIRDSRRESFQEMKILPLCSQYIFSLMLYVVNNRHLFTKNSEIHNIDTKLIPPPPPNYLIN